MVEEFGVGDCIKSCGEIKDAAVISCEEEVVGDFVSTGYQGKLF